MDISDSPGHLLLPLPGVPYKHATTPGCPYCFQYLPYSHQGSYDTLIILTGKLIKKWAAKRQESQICLFVFRKSVLKEVRKLKPVPLQNRKHVSI